MKARCYCVFLCSPRPKKKTLNNQDHQMVTYSYIPPEYKKAKTMPYTPSPLSQCTTVDAQEHRVETKTENEGKISKAVKSFSKKLAAAVSRN